METTLKGKQKYLNSIIDYLTGYQGLKQKVIAERIGENPSTLSQYYSGNRANEHTLDNILYRITTEYADLLPPIEEINKIKKPNTATQSEQIINMYRMITEMNEKLNILIAKTN